MSKLNDMSKGREIPQLEILIPWNIVGSTNGGEHLGLLDGVDTEVGFQVEIKIKHVLRVSGFFGDNRENFHLDRVFDRCLNLLLSGWNYRLVEYICRYG